MPIRTMLSGAAPKLPATRYKMEPQTLTGEVHFLAGSGAACGAVASEAAPDLACFAAQLRVRRDADG